MATAQAEKKGMRTLSEEEVKPQKRFKQPPKSYTNKGADKRASGNYTSELINPKFAAQVQLQRMKIDEGPLWWRPYPMVAPETEDVLLPTREEEADDNGCYPPTDWMVLLNVAQGIGIDTWKTFMLNLPATLTGADPDRERNNPYSTFFWNAYNSSPENKKHPQKATFRDKWRPAWTALMRGSTGKSAPMKKPGLIAVIRGELWQVGEKNFLVGEKGAKGYPLGRRAGDPLQLLACSPSSTKALSIMLKKTDAPVDEESGEPVGEGNLMFPEIVGTLSKSGDKIIGGRFLQFFTPAVNKGPAYCKDDSSWKGNLPTDGTPILHQVRIRSGFPISKTEDLPPTIHQNGITNLINKAYPWFPTLNDEGEWEQTGMLYYPSDEEMVLWIAQCYSTQGVLLDYALFSEHPEWRTADVKAILKNRTQATKPDSEGGAEEPSGKRQGKTSPGYKPRDLEEEEGEEQEEEEEKPEEEEAQASNRDEEDEEGNEEAAASSEKEEEEEDDEFAPRDEEAEENAEEEADEKLNEDEFEESVMRDRGRANGKPAGKPASPGRPDTRPSGKKAPAEPDEYDAAAEAAEDKEEAPPKRVPPKQVAAPSSGKKPTKKVPPKRAGKR